MSFPDLIERKAVLRLVEEHREVARNARWWTVQIAAIPAATASGTKPSVNWDHLRPDAVFIAQDEGGCLYAYAAKPSCGEDVWHPSGASQFWDVSALASYNPGTCDWRDSLVMRPGYTGE